MKDDGPYQTQGQLGVSIGDVIVPDVDQLDLWDLKLSNRSIKVLI